ncbi:NAD kinase 2 chloroplastic [Zea mays]|uniref:NAD kinase 2 chloroplastic n=1 Tax=Zea mays TaxID=4577 RepID=A0A1D6EH57_MAIZE|nr:NAD kinase 2 chloroplastic [Zea mays]
MLDVCAPHGPAKLPAAFVAGVRVAWVAGRWWWRSVAVGAARHGVTTRASFFGLDSQNFQTRDPSQLLWIGPVPGDIAEIEAYCRIFRAAEQLHTAVMSALCDPETGECPVRYDVESEDLPILEDKVTAVLGCMLALLNRGRNEVLSGRSGVASAFHGSVDSTSDMIPPLTLFRGDMKRCCESMQLALASYLVPSEPRGLNIWRKLQRLKNACYDAGFSRPDGYPCPTLFANWFPVYLSIVSDDSGTDEPEVAFWRGGQVSEEGLAWLLEKGFKTIVDLREEDVKDDLYLSAVQEAVSSGKIEVVNMLVEIGTAPSAEQVKQFAALVSDGAKKPIYLHSKEGVSRTSAMVSRWKQYVTRSERLAVQNHYINGNGKVLTSDKTKQHTGSPSSSMNRTEIGMVTESDRTMNNGESCEIDIETARHNLEVTNALSDDQSTQQGEMLGTGTEPLSNFKLESNPLKAQFPTCDIFSRKEMSKFFRSKKVYPKSVLNSRRQSSSLLVSRRKQNFSTERNGTIDYEAAEFTILESSNGTSFDNDYILSVSSGITDGKPSNNGAFSLIEKKEREVSVTTFDTRASASSSNGKVQVASFLHHQEKMNVLVEPDVHDTFARIPGYGFVQTFYTQDTSGKAMPDKVFDVLNEVVVDRGSNPYLSKIECYEHNHLITKVQGDGVIVATPTGSTAYSTAAGGSMVHPNVPCMLFTPICPHSLSFRPVILPDSARLELKIPDEARSNAWVSFDGKRRQQLSRGDSVRISMSQHPLPTVNKSDQTGDWFRSLIRCLNWNERLDQKAL